MPARAQEVKFVVATILLVEDDPETARSLCRALESSGYHVLIAETGGEARSIIDQVPPDLAALVGALLRSPETACRCFVSLP